MASAETVVEGRVLEETSTWAVATVCFFLIAISLVIEHLLHLLAKYLHRKRRHSLLQALDKVKSELMLLGFISLMLTASEKPIANMCIPKSLEKSFLPCGQFLGSGEFVEESKCQNQGKVSLLSRSGVQQLQMLIFALAFFHALSCILTFGLGMAKMKRWESWEAETQTMEYQFKHDPRRFKFIHETSFGKRHLRFWSGHRFLRWPACFLRQFYSSVSRTDYVTLRHGFITAHFAGKSNYDFHKFVKRTLEGDFQVVVGTSWGVWIFFVLFIFFNAHVFYTYLWLPFIPLVLLLLVGAKLQDVITRMCLDSTNKGVVVTGTLLVRPSDHFFWFHSPKLLLHIMHFILFQNSFQVAFFFWSWMKFGFRSCFHKQTDEIIISLVMGLLVQLLCGYATLPLYALVTQMGTSMRETVFTEGVVMGLRMWQARARRNLQAGRTIEPTRPSLRASIEILFGS